MYELEYRYVLERSPQYIKIWFWARNDPSVPSEVVNGAAVVDPNTWVSNSQPSLFGRLIGISSREPQRHTFPIPHVIFLLTCGIISSSSIWRFVNVFCSPLLHNNWVEIAGGDWAGAFYSQSGCPSTCVGGSFLLPFMTSCLLINVIKTSWITIQRPLLMHISILLLYAFTSKSWI